MAAAVAVGLLSLALILVLGRWLPRVPGVLVAVVVAIASSAVLDLGRPRRLARRNPAQGISAADGAKPDIGSAAAGRRRARNRARRADRHDLDRLGVRGAHGQEVDGNGEMIGIGAANVAAGFFQGFPVSTSGSRTAVAEQAGAKTQLTGRRRGGADRADARARARAAEEPPEPNARRRRNRRVAVARRHPGDGAAVASASGRVPALRSRRFSGSRCSGCSRASRSRSGSRS